MGVLGGAGRARWLGLLLVPAFWNVVAHAATAPRQDPSKQGARASLNAQLDVERELLVADRARYRDAAAGRDAASDRLATLHSKMDALIAGEEDGEPVDGDAGEQIDEMARQIVEAEQARSSALGRCSEMIGRLRERSERILILERKLAQLQLADQPAVDEPLTGSWDVVYVPTGEKGTFTLTQSGTLVTGEYVLMAGGEALRGNLDGSFTAGRLSLRRIDSRLGHSSDLEGTLESDGWLIRGTWQNTNLSGASNASGMWTALRRRD